MTNNKSNYKMSKYGEINTCGIDTVHNYMFTKTCYIKMKNKNLSPKKLNTWVKR